MRLRLGENYVFKWTDNVKFLFGFCSKKIISTQKASLLIPRICCCGALTVHCLHFGLTKFTKWLTYSNLWTKHMIFSIGQRYAVLSESLCQVKSTNLHFVILTQSDKLHPSSHCRHQTSSRLLCVAFSVPCPLCLQNGHRHRTSFSRHRCCT